MTIRQLLLVAALAALGCGCGRDGEPEAAPAADPYDTRYSRMEDPEYRQALKEREDSRKELMRRETALMRELEQAKAEDPDSPKVKELEAKCKQLAAEHIRQRAVTQQLVAERIKREQQAIERRKAEDLKKAKAN